MKTFTCLHKCVIGLAVLTVTAGKMASAQAAPIVLIKSFGKLDQSDVELIGGFAKNQWLSGLRVATLKRIPSEYQLYSMSGMLSKGHTGKWQESGYEGDEFYRSTLRPMRHTNQELLGISTINNAMPRIPWNAPENLVHQIC